MHTQYQKEPEYLAVSQPAPALDLDAIRVRLNEDPSLHRRDQERADLTVLLAEVERLRAIESAVMRYLRAPGPADDDVVEAYHALCMVCKYDSRGDAMTAGD